MIIVTAQVIHVGVLQHEVFIYADNETVIGHHLVIGSKRRAQFMADNWVRRMVTKINRVAAQL